MSCANHSIYVLGRNVNLSQFSVFAKGADGEWYHVTDGLALQAELKARGAESVELSVCPRGATISEASSGWIVEQSSKYLLGKGKQIAAGKEDPLGKDRATSHDHEQNRIKLAVTCVSSAVKDRLVSSQEKESKDWRRAQADGMLRFHEELVAMGTPVEQALNDTVRVALGSQFSRLDVLSELRRAGIGVSDTREAVAVLHRMVKDDTLAPALHTLESFSAHVKRSDVSARLLSRRSMDITAAESAVRALRAPGVSTRDIGVFFSGCSRSGVLDKEELDSPAVRSAIANISSHAVTTPGPTVMDIADLAASIATSRPSLSTGTSGMTYRTMDGTTVGFEGLSVLNSIDPTDVAAFLQNPAVTSSRSGMAETLELLHPDERRAEPQQEFDPPARVVRAARALKVAQAALAYNVTAYGGPTVLAIADRVEAATNGASIQETRRFIEDVLAHSDPVAAESRRAALHAAESQARTIIRTMITGALPKERVDESVLADVTDYTKAVDDIVQGVLTTGDPATFLRAISSSVTTRELMRFSVANGYVPRQAGSANATAEDINRVFGPAA